MTRTKLIYLHNYLYYIYSPQIKILFDNEHNVFWSRLNPREIALPTDIKLNPTDWSLFAFLHELGHVITNTEKMKRCYQEYLATQWALQEAQNIQFKVPKTYIEIYQEYIWKWRLTGLKLGGKNIPSEQSLILHT